MKKYVWIALVLLAAGGGIYGIYISAHPKTVASLASVSSSEAPWPAEGAHLKERLAAIGLPALPSEGTAYHIHQHLDIFVHGNAVPVPPAIGVHESYPPYITSLHTHDETGIIHVESPTEAKFYLGQFFDVWGVRLSAECLGAYCTDGKNTLVFYVDGKPYSGDPRQIELTAHEEIAISYGTPAEAPKPVPAGYAFPQGY